MWRAWCDVSRYALYSAPSQRLIMEGLFPAELRQSIYSPRECGEVEKSALED